MNIDIWIEITSCIVIVYLFMCIWTVEYTFHFEASAEMRAGNTVLASTVKIPSPTWGLLRIFLLEFTDKLEFPSLRTSSRIGFSFCFNLCFLSFPSFIVSCSKLKQISQSAWIHSSGQVFKKLYLLSLLSCFIFWNILTRFSMDCLSISAESWYTATYLSKIF